MKCAPATAFSQNSFKSLHVHSFLYIYIHFRIFSLLEPSVVHCVLKIIYVNIFQTNIETQNNIKDKERETLYYLNYSRKNHKIIARSFLLLISSSYSIPQAPPSTGCTCQKNQIFFLKMGKRTFVAFVDYKTIKKCNFSLSLIFSDFS